MECVRPSPRHHSGLAGCAGKVKSQPDRSHEQRFGAPRAATASGSATIGDEREWHCQGETYVETWRPGANKGKTRLDSTKFDCQLLLLCCTSSNVEKGPRVLEVLRERSAAQSSSGRGCVSEIDAVWACCSDRGAKARDGRVVTGCDVKKRCGKLGSTELSNAHSAGGCVIGLTQRCKQNKHPAARTAT